MAADDYMVPDGFRMHFNGLAQNLRSVSWLVQKQKAKLPEFGSWYGHWQETATKDDVMKWLVRSRNRIVKEDDLEIRSTAKVRYSLDWLHEHEYSWDMPPRLNTRSILVRILSSGRVPPFGILTIERKWSERLLPEWELLHAMAHVYGQLVRLVMIAHVKAGVEQCDLAPRERPCVTAELRGARLGCMESKREGRVLHIDLSDRSEYVEDYRDVRFSEEERHQAGVRYGTVPMVGTLAELVSSAFEIAKRMLILDKALMTVAWLIRDNAVIEFYPLDFPDQAGKRLTMHRLAERVGQVGADGVVFIGESWLAFAGPDEDLRSAVMLPASLRPDRQEAIQVVGVNRSGETSDRTLSFKHGSDQEIVFGELMTDLGGQANFLEPVRRKWAEKGAASSKHAPSGELPIPRVGEAKGLLHRLKVSPGVAHPAEGSN